MKSRKKLGEKKGNSENPFRQLFGHQMENKQKKNKQNLELLSSETQLHIVPNQ